MANMHANSNRNPVFSADKWVLLLYIVLVIAGWFSICGASHEFGDMDFLSWNFRSGKQAVWIGMSFMLGFFILMFDDRNFEKYAPLLYFITILVLVITPFIASDTKGSLSWISFGPSVKLQPAEFAKCTTALMLARYMGRYDFSMADTFKATRAVGIVLLPIILIIFQRETGSALVYLAFFLMFYREGMPGVILFTAAAAVFYFVVGIRFSENIFPGTASSIGEVVVLAGVWIFVAGMTRVYSNGLHARRIVLSGAAVIGVSLLISRYLIEFDVTWVLIGYLILASLYLAWTGMSGLLTHHYLIAAFALCSVAFLYSADYTLSKLAPHQQLRIEVLLGIKDDPTGAGYNVSQSKIAIGSGGLSGKGFMKGTQTKLKYVPEQDTDFIFCTVGEEEGFTGSAGVLLCFLLLILRLIVIAERQVTDFGRVYAYSVLSILLFHLFINVGMVLGLTPVIGIPLPFFSYGGSSLWGFTILLFILLRIDASNKYKHK